MGSLVQSMLKPSFKSLIEPTVASHMDSKSMDKKAAALEAENARVTAENARKLRGNVASSSNIAPRTLLSSSASGEETKLGGR